jgi:lysylphosphatidylglycerol synthetase-like protein (DUF2156 family)
MANCPKCGAEADDLATVCPNCGTQIESKPSSLDAPMEPKDTPSPPPKAERRKPSAPSSPVSDVTKRPQVALISAILLVVGGALMAYFCIPYLIGAYQGGVSVTYTATTTLTTITNSTTATSTSTVTSQSFFSSSLLTAVGIPYLLAGVASLFAGYGFLKRMNLAWRLALVVSVFGIIQTFLLISDPYNLFIGAATLYFQTRPAVRAWLKGTTSTEATKK